ncbi:MAG: TetR/AcrR family transcriptional regulator [Myxococcota bacterium]
MGAKPANTPRRDAKQERAKQTIEAIVEAAAQVLIERGYESATTNRIAERAGVSVGSLYQYFSDKDAVFERLLERQAARLVEGFARFEPDPRRPLRETLRDLLRLSISINEYGPEVSRDLASAPNDLLRHHVSRARLPIVELLAEVLKLYEDDLGVQNIDSAAQLIVAASEGVAFYARAEEFNDHLADELARMFEGYLYSKAP